MRSPFKTNAAISDKLDTARENRYDQLRELIKEHRRFDILAKYVLNTPLEDFQRDMIDWQEQTEEGLLLGFRGSWKTSLCTITRAIGEIICDPNVRILFAAESADQAKMFLRGVKTQFENNDLLKKLFGDFVTGAKIWQDGEIMVAQRQSAAKEGTITCMGTDSALPGRHFDIIICDDIVTKANSQTPAQRKKVFDWFYETLYPTLEPVGGRLWVLGTRWDDEDFLGWLEKEDYRATTIRFPVLDENDQSVWEEKFPTAKMHRIRKGNLGAFERQYMVSTGQSLGGIFTPDHFTYEDGAYPTDMFLWQGVDLAAGLLQRNDKFAHATVGVHKQTREPWVYDIMGKRMPFDSQVQYIKHKYQEYPRTVRVVIESNAYQIIMTQHMRNMFPDIPIQPQWQIQDKAARKNQTAVIVGPGRLHVRRSMHGFVRHLCALKGLRKEPDDEYDAFDLAYRQGLKGARRKRQNEPGLI